MADRIRKTVRFSDETQSILNELKKIYKMESENALLEVIIKEIWEQKQSRALIPYEEFEKREQELKKLYFELGRLKTELEQKEKELEKEKNKGFWARLFGKWRL